jgi:hypothetical protein
MQEHHLPVDNILQRLQSFTKYWLLNRRENNGYKGLAFRYNLYLITDFLAGGIENSSTNLTSQNALLREIYEERYIYFIGTMRHLLTIEEQITLVRLKSKLVLMEHRNV